MNAKERMTLLLAKGYFPKELPPAFTTADFGQNAEEVMLHWQAEELYKMKPAKKYKGKKKRDAYLYAITSAEAETISAPKRGFERRNLHITHPIPQLVLTHEISSSWVTIKKWAMRQAFSLDQISVVNEAPRGLTEINFVAHRAKKGFIEATANWLVKSDIKRFYPSIYTHSIPWAAYGKENVKRRLGAYEGSLADRLDQLVRACNRNQTIGIPVVPETSRIIAEIISSRVDLEYSKELFGVSLSSIDRLQDDWFVGCNSLEQADLILSRITLTYREFSLEINGSKTSIEKTSSVSEQQWVSELGSFLSHADGVPTGRRLSEFLNLGLRMQVAYPHQPITNYLISTIENNRISSSDAAAVESFLLRSATLSPSSLSGIARVLINLHHDTKAISVKRVCKRLRQELCRHAENENTLEVIWLLYALRGLSSPVKVSEVGRYATGPISSAVGLILLDMDARGLVIGRLPKSSWADQIDEDVARSSGLWLLAYEGIRHGWLGDPHALAGKPFFKPMLDRQITFYDPRRNVPTTKTTVRRRRRARARARRDTFALIQHLRGFDVDEYE